MPSPYVWLTDDDALERFAAFVAAYEDAVARGAIKPLLSRDGIAMGEAIMDGIREGLREGLAAGHDGPLYVNGTPVSVGRAAEVLGVDKYALRAWMAWHYRGELSEAERALVRTAVDE